jgi:CRISPR/Cas system CMR-associated protein Cmr3 (group 5 of RAMP superfamily)
LKYEKKKNTFLYSICYLSFDDIFLAFGTSIATPSDDLAFDQLGCGGDERYYTKLIVPIQIY